nr:hypothetical protein [uncultured Mucilaginibacter sp.]
MKKHIAFLLLAFLVIPAINSCNFSANGTWVNDHIDGGIQTEIHPLNKKLFRAFMANDVAAAKKLMSPGLLAQTGTKMDTIMTAVAKSFNAADYEVVDEYYTKNSGTGVNNTLISNKGNSNDYTINYTALNKEMYVSLLSPKNLPVTCLILAIYGKYDDAWKINILQVGEYKILNKTAPDFYNDALKLYNKGSLIDAANLMFTASELKAPGDKLMSYKNDAVMKSFFEKVVSEANAAYKFPVTLTAVATKPSVFAITPQLLAAEPYKGIYPVIKYLSAINLADTIALKAENKEVQKNIGGVLKGIDQDKTYVIYQAFNQMPDGKTPMKHYGFLQKLQ